MTQQPPPIIYNIFPRLVGDLSTWPEHAARAKEMGFNWIYINPVHYPGFSGSLYAVKDFYRLNPLFIPPGDQDPLEALRQSIAAMRDLGLRVMMDLVINHTAIDSVLAAEHPEWFLHNPDGSLVSPSAIDPADARNVTMWGDLAELDHEGSSDKEGMWQYWEELLRSFLSLGFDGFRCDAAYKVSPKLWTRLIAEARRHNPDALFAAETLGCRLDEVAGLAGAGFDFLFNSSKYWNFDAPWALEQHAEFRAIAPSIAFAESHDTPRLMEETGGEVAVQKQRYLFSAIFSAGLLMPMGYEYGFRRKLDVVSSAPDQWEDTGLDLSPFITRVNQLKQDLPVLGDEGLWEVVSNLEGPTTLLCKHGTRVPGAVLALINKDWLAPQSLGLPANLKRFLPGKVFVARPCRDEAPAELPTGQATFMLDPAEIVLLFTE